MQKTGTSAELRYLSLWLPTFSDHFLSHFRKLSQLLRMLKMLKMHINFPGKNLAINLLVLYNANSTQDNTVDSDSFAMMTSVGHSILNSTPALNVYNITLINSHM